MTMNFVPDGFFPEADSAWIPTLGDVLIRQNDPASTEYWNRVGWQNLSVPDDCARVQNRMDTLATRFNERYFNRMLNSETLERWQVRLQNRFDEVVRRYERAYELYETYKEDMLEDVLEGELRTVDNTTTQGGSDTSENRNIDTPDEVVNQNENYASSLSKGKVNYGRIETVNGTERRTVTGSALIDNINNSIYDWRDLDTEFVGEFENLFMNVFWY